MSDTARYPRAKLYQDLILLLCFGLLPLGWFNHEYLVTGGDANFPLDHGKWLLSRLFVWNNQFNTGVEAAINPTTLFFHGVQAFSYWLGASLSQAQRLSYVFWFTLQALSMYFLVAVVQRQDRVRRLERWISVVVYAFVPIMFNVWEVGKAAELSCIVGMPFVLGMCLLATQTRRWITCAAGVALASPIFSEAGASPPVFAIPIFVVGLWAAFHVVWTPAERRPTETQALWRFGILLVVFYTLINTYWLLPYLHEITSKIQRNPSGGLEAFNLDNWLRGISTHTSLLNVSRFQGAWDWYYGFNDEQYVAYAPRFLHHPALIVLSLALPIAAYGALILRRTRWVVSFATLGLIMTLFATGAHPPFGSIYLWLTAHIPFFTMFRSPYYKFGLGLALAYAYLIGVTAGELERRVMAWQREHAGQLRPRLAQTDAPPRPFGQWIARIAWPRMAAAGMFGAILAYGHPMLNGEIIYTHTNMPSLKLQIPPYIFEAARWLDQDGSDARVLSLPRDAIDNYRWGYGSILHIMNLVTLRPVLYSREFASVFESALKVRETLYDALYRARTPFVHRILGLLYADLILLRGDSWHDLYTHTLSPKTIRSLLAEQSGVALTTKIGEWEFYTSGTSIPKIQVATSLNLVKGGQGQALAPLTYTDRLDAGRAVLFTEDLAARTPAALRALMAQPLIDTVVLYNARLRDLIMEFIEGPWIHPWPADGTAVTARVPEAGTYLVAIKRREDPGETKPARRAHNEIIVDAKRILPIAMRDQAGMLANGRWCEVDRLYLTPGPHTLALALTDASIEALAVIPMTVWSPLERELHEWLQSPEGPELFFIHPTDYMRTVFQQPETGKASSAVRIQHIQNFYSRTPTVMPDRDWRWLQAMHENLMIQNESPHPATTSLGFEVLTFGEDRDLRLYLGEEQIWMEFLQMDQTYQVVVRNLRFAPGMNTIKLWSPHSTSRIPDERWEDAPQGWSFAFRNFQVGQLEFLDEVELPRAGRYQISLYPYPATRSIQARLAADPPLALFLGDSVVPLTVSRDPDGRYAWYSSGPLSLESGRFPVRIPQRIGEEYYLIIRSLDRTRPLQVPDVSFTRQNLVKYRVRVPPTSESSMLVFSETYSPHWWIAGIAPEQAAPRISDHTWWGRLILSDAPALGVSCLLREDHLFVNGYANGWLLKPSPVEERAFVIVYMPQLLMEAGVVISGIALIAVGWVFARGLRRR